MQESAVRKDSGRMFQDRSECGYRPEAEEAALECVSRAGVRVQTREL